MNKGVEKEFGKISTNETVHLFRLLEKVFKDAEQIAENIEDPKEMPVLNWCPLYELDFNQSLALFFHSAGLLGALKEIAESDNPQAAILEFAENFEPPEGIDQRMTDQDKVNFSASLMCIFQNLAAIGRYSKPINDLLIDAKNGDDYALFNAIDIDPSVVSTETAAWRISRAVIEQDKAFLDQLGRAVKGGYPRKKPDPDYDLLRLLSRILEESLGDLPLDSAELQRLAVDQLGIYPDENESSDSRGNLTRFVTRARQKARTQK